MTKELLFLAVGLAIPLLIAAGYKINLNEYHEECYHYEQIPSIINMSFSINQRIGRCWNSYITGLSNESCSCKFQGYENYNCTYT